MTGITRRAFLQGIVAGFSATIASARVAMAASETDGAPLHHRNEITAFEFAPRSLSVRHGDTITWTNRDFVPHTVSALDGSWDSGELAFAESWTLTIASETSGAYFCRFHPHMRATFTVKP